MLSMANAIVGWFLMAMLCITTIQGRTTHHSNNGWSTSSSIISDGVCKTRVETQGYTCEEHEVTTEDGYILSLQRIPVQRFSKKAHKQPVLLYHGITQDAITWLLNSKDESLPFILANNGYDVWLASTRGTKYSRGHISLGPNDMDYWNWTWEELASYDLPAFVQYVYNNTGQRIHYTGHSLGTLLALAALSQGKLLNMLRSAALLAPIAHTNQTTSQILHVGAQTCLLEVPYWLGIREFIPNGDAATKFLGGICHKLNLNCTNLIALITGPNSYINPLAQDIFFNHGLQSTSTKNMIHLAQMIISGQVEKFDYGTQNMIHYGQPIPPVYDLAKIPNKFPLFISYGGKDALSDVNDVHVLLKDLKNHNEKKLTLLFKEDYGHLDFVMAVNAKQMIYDPVLTFFSIN